MMGISLVLSSVDRSFIGLGVNWKIASFGQCCFSCLHIMGQLPCVVVDSNASLWPIWVNKQIHINIYMAKIWLCSIKQQYCNTRQTGCRLVLSQNMCSYCPHRGPLPNPGGVEIRVQVYSTQTLSGKQVKLARHPLMVWTSRHGDFSGLPVASLLMMLFPLVAVTHILNMQWNEIWAVFACWGCLIVWMGPQLNIPRTGKLRSAVIQMVLVMA